MANSMTPEAIQNDVDMGIPLIDPKKIYLDHDFNSRDEFSPTSCIELARDVQRRGLLQPITVRPLREKDHEGQGNEQALIKQGYTHKAVAGHRRLTAYQINEADVIPCIVKDAYISEFDAKDINACENLQRSELTLAEECASIRHYWYAGWSREETADRIQKSQGWVQVRYMLLEMPKEIMDLAGQGYVKASDVRELNKYRGNHNELLQAAAKVRDARKAGMKHKVRNLVKKQDKSTTKKIRGRDETFAMMDTIREVLSDANMLESVPISAIVSPQGNCFATKCLAWSAGEITTGDFHIALKEFCEHVGIDYQMPEFSDPSIEEVFI